jgi:hypothetical protein
LRQVLTMQSRLVLKSLSSCLSFQSAQITATPGPILPSFIVWPYRLVVKSGGFGSLDTSDSCP